MEQLARRLQFLEINFSSAAKCRKSVSPSWATRQHQEVLLYVAGDTGFESGQEILTLAGFFSGMSSAVLELLVSAL